MSSSIIRLSRSIADVARNSAAIVFTAFLFVSLLGAAGRASAQVTLTALTVPQAAEPNVQLVRLTGGGFPTAAISASNITVSLTPSGGGGSVSTTASGFTRVAGPVAQVAFTVPSSLVLNAPTAYLVSISGTTTTGTAFSSKNSSTLTIVPPASVTLGTVAGQAGQTLTVGINGTYSNFAQGATTANFGAGISVRGAAANSSALVTVTSATTATAQITIATNAPIQQNTVTIATGNEVETATFTINKATQTIAFTAPTSATYGASPLTLSATATSGLPVTFSVLSGPGTVSGSTLTITGGGTIVVAANQAGNADYAAATQVTQSIVVSAATQTIAFTAPATEPSSASPLTLSATATSGLPVTFSVLSGPGTVSGNTLTFTGTGTVIVAANQAGNANYAAATQVTQSIVVSAATQTIAFTAPATETYGVAPLTLSATATSGLPVTFSVLSGPGTVSGNTLTFTGAGTIVVAADQAGNNNYAAAPQVTQSIVVSSGTQTITFSLGSASIKVGGTETLNASATSGLAISYTSTTPAVCSVDSSTGLLTGLATGACSITASQAGNSGYSAATPVTASLQVIANVASYNITAAFSDTTIFKGTLTVNLETGTATGLTGSLTEAMVGPPQSAIGLPYQLSSVNDSNGGLLVSAFAENSKPVSGIRTAG
jgi:hypothetical protein